MRPLLALAVIAALVLAGCAKSIDDEKAEKFIAKSVEEQVGADLQYIRMNGTIVGGIIGAAIYICETLLR